MVFFFQLRFDLPATTDTVRIKRRTYFLISNRPANPKKTTRGAYQGRYRYTSVKTFRRLSTSSTSRFDHRENFLENVRASTTKTGQIDGKTDNDNSYLINVFLEYLRTRSKRDVFIGPVLKKPVANQIENIVGNEEKRNHGRQIRLGEIVTTYCVFT